MKPNKYFLFTTSTCHACKNMKDFFDKMKIQGKSIDIVSNEGNNIAANFEIKNIPTAIFFDEREQEIGRALNIFDAREILSS